MTLKEFLENYDVSANKDDRSKIGMLLANIDTTKNKVIEDGWLVKDYDLIFLQSEKCVEIIIDYFKKQSI